MPNYLFIVESPKKIKTIKQFLSSDYDLMASIGHIRQIPVKGLNIDVNNDFATVYEVDPDKKDVVSKIKKAASKSDKIYLATDLDREGEAIAWHLYDLLPKKDQAKCTRVTYAEITKTAILKAIQNTRDIDMNLVNAQKSRQILDRLIGYKISPVLWYTAHISKSSAGRVQSIALKLICERQKEIDAFKPEDFWYIDALLKCKKGEFWARVVTKDKDNRYLDEKNATEDFDKLKQAKYAIHKIDRKERLVSASPPFDTNSLQGACANLFGWSLSKSKTIAQKLYEQGLVTYIRSDSFNIAKEALDEVRTLISKNSSKEYLPSKPNVYSKKSSAAAQEAHECIRPTHVENDGDNIDDDDEQKMYKLIRDRFIACQMSPMIVDSVIYDIKASSKHKLVAKGQTVKFDGWYKVYKYSKTKEEILPDASEGEELGLKDIKKDKKTTKPPARYNEASLAKKMEDAGVGRPSTRDSIITSIQKKGYVDKESGKGKRGLIATDFGMRIFDYLQCNFADFFMDIQYTSQIEADLDEIANGNKKHLEIIRKFYDQLTDQIKKAQKDTPPREEPKTTGIKCSVCKKGEITEKTGRFGKFFGCSDYKNCKTIYVQNDDGSFSVKKKGATAKSIGRKCPKCQEAGRDGNLVLRKNKSNGNSFIGCSNFFKGCRYSESVEESSIDE